MQRVTNVKPLENYLLLLQFQNGEKRVFNCYPLLKDKLFEKLKDVDFFKTVHIDDMGLVCWDEATDINPYALYEQSEPITHFAFVG